MCRFPLFFSILLSVYLREAIRRSHRILRRALRDGFNPTYPHSASTPARKKYSPYVSITRPSCPTFDFFHETQEKDTKSADPLTSLTTFLHPSRPRQTLEGKLSMSQMTHDPCMYATYAAHAPRSKQSLGLRASFRTTPFSIHFFSSFPLSGVSSKVYTKLRGGRNCVIR